MRYLISLITFCLLSTINAQSIDYLPSSNGELITHTYFSSSYIEDHEQSEWVAYYLSPEMLKKVYKRKNTFKPDNSVSTGTALYSDYQSAPDYDAGHLLPCRQMQFDCDAMNETFLMSNMSPQAVSFNRNKWAFLEKLERNMAWRNNGIYVITGPVLTTTSGHIGVSTKISIPKYFYKIFLSYTDDSTKAIAFLLPNKKESTPFIDYVVSIDSLEALTNIDFFPSLPDKLEDSLESTITKSLWDFSNPSLNYDYAKKEIICNSKAEVNRTNLNSASLDDLKKLPKIGKKKASKIIAARPFNKIEDILKVPGIGQKTFDKLQPLIKVE